MTGMQSQASEHDRIRHNLTNHPPEDAAIGELMDRVTEASIAYADVIDECVPGGREKSLALTDVERASQSAKAGIARNQAKLLGQ